MTMIQYFGVDGKPKADKVGVLERRAEYDQDGKQKKGMLIYASSDGKMSREDGIAEMHIEYDTCGNATKEQCFGVDGKLALHKKGYAELRREFDAHGNMTRVRCFGVDGKPRVNKDGFYELRLEYDERGKVKSALRFDASGNPIQDDKPGNGEPKK